MRVTNRYLFPPMLKTTQLPTRLAVPNSAFTLPHDCHSTVLLLTCVLVQVCRDKVRCSSR